MRNYEIILNKIFEYLEFIIQWFLLYHLSYPLILVSRILWMCRKETSNHNIMLVILIILQQHTIICLDKSNENENSIDLVSGRLLYILISFSSFFSSIHNVNCQYPMTNWIIINELYVNILIILIFIIFIIWFNYIFPCYHHNRWFHQLILSEQTSKNSISRSIERK